MNIIDISQPVAAGVAVWPGDQPYELAWTMQRERGDSVNVAALTLSVHTGTHADGALHVRDGGEAAGTAPLERYIGPATVVDARGRSSLGPDAVANLGPDVVRVLFRTRDAVDPRAFPDRVAAVTPALARQLAGAGILLLGTDAPSVDPLDSKALEAHRVLVGAGIAIVENLDLSRAEPGDYTFVGLPLRLTDADSAPVRAVLIRGALG